MYLIMVESLVRRVVHLNHLPRLLQGAEEDLPEHWADISQQHLVGSDKLFISLTLPSCKEVDIVGDFRVWIEKLLPAAGHLHICHLEK